MSVEDLLQARLSLLESGHELDACLEGVPEEIAELLRLANSIRSLEWPQINPQIALAQRSCLEKMSVVLLSKQEETPVVKMNNNFRSFWLRRDHVALAFSTLVLLILCAIVTFSIGGSWLFNQNTFGVAGKAPIVSRNFDEAVLRDSKGLVEILSKGNWSKASKFKYQINSGMHIRTASLSSTTIHFADGSQIYIGPETELVLEELEIQTAENLRNVIITQLSGTSEHTVSPDKNKNSIYEVRTSTATGKALGTIFKVQVKSDASAWFSVSEGEVSVSGNNETVIVEAGETTIAATGARLTKPEYYFSGSGEVSYIGDTWVIDGQVLVTHPSTAIIGSPQIGDQVKFEGRLLSEETKILDLIKLVHQSQENRFSIIGIVEKLNDTIWTVNSQKIAVTDITVLQAEILQGDLIYVEGMVFPDGSLQADHIQKFDEQPGSNFELKGVIEEISDKEWTVSGLVLQIDSNTRLEPNLNLGDLVQVEGRILDDNTWQANSIYHTVDEVRSFEFAGIAENLAPWSVAGVEFEIRDWTIIDEYILIGNLVNVSGHILEDGTWVAHEITRLEAPGEFRFSIIGTVTRINPWVVSGNTLVIDTDTVISNEILLGMLVRANVQVLENGGWKILNIMPVNDYSWVFGCHDLVAQFVNFSDGQMQLQGWPGFPLDKRIDLPKNLEPNSILLLQICINEDGKLQISKVNLLYQPPIEEIQDHDSSELPNQKNVLCHKPLGNNPHTIVVSRSAVPAHLGHGDKLGTCP